jgi:hypothetical protein
MTGFGPVVKVHKSSCEAWEIGRVARASTSLHRGGGGLFKNQRVRFATATAFRRRAGAFDAMPMPDGRNQERAAGTGSRTKFLIAVETLRDGGAGSQS